MGVVKKMIYDYENKTLQIKIVYYGPAMSGKTTSIKKLFSYFNRQNDLESIDSSVGRTLFFDFGVLNFRGAEWGLKFLIYSATGQDFYASTRPATLNGVDGIIFIVDSHTSCLRHNLRSWKELNTMLGSEFFNIPVVICMNKDDINDDTKMSEIEFRDLIDINTLKNVYVQKTAAIRGYGIIEAFNRMIKFIFPQLTLNMNITN
jgi:signal recognition particle receptor subunit beta